MPRRVITKRAVQTKMLATLLGCMALVGIGFAPAISFASGIGHAETDKAIAAKLDKLGYQEGEAIDRIQHYRVDGWNYLDNQHIVIYAGPTKRFLVTTMAECPDLDTTEHIGFTSTVGNLTKFDKLIVRGPGGIVQKCPIAEIKTLQKRK